MTTFYPIIGWPAGRGEYDNFFKNFKIFCKTLDHWNFLFNFSSFLFGFSIPKRNKFSSAFTSKYENKDLRDILINETGMDKNTAKKLIILLDVGGNRIFNKIVNDRLPLGSVESYQLYLQKYLNFIKNGNPDYFVNFDIGPSYSSRDKIAIEGRNQWKNLSDNQKKTLNNSLLDLSIKYKPKGTKLMVPINALYPKKFKLQLEIIHNKYKDKIDSIGIAGIANKSIVLLNEILRIIHDFKIKTNWDFEIHGLGLGGWKKIPYLINYGINSCDVATPWRRACTERISEVYIPFIDGNLEFTEFEDIFSYNQLYDNFYNDLECNCPFCLEIPMSEIRQRCMNADKKNANLDQHGPDFREMRIRVFFHNVYQHIALLKKLEIYKNEDEENFLKNFIRDIPNELARKKFQKVIKILLN